MNTRTILAVLLVFAGVAALLFSGAAFTLRGTMLSAERFIAFVFAASITGPIALVGGIVILMGNPERNRL